MAISAISRHADFWVLYSCSALQSGTRSCEIVNNGSRPIIAIRMVGYRTAANDQKQIYWDSDKFRIAPPCLDFQMTQEHWKNLLESTGIIAIVAISDICRSVNDTDVEFDGYE
jgi:hypothetical protein